MQLNSKTTFSERLHLPTLGYVQISYYSCSGLCYQLYKDCDEIARQSSIPHLGLISRKYPGSHHTRWEYAALQCALIDILDRVHKDNLEVGLGSLKCEGESLQGSEILKSWALLGNYGHCANTFSDEKAFLNDFRKNSSRRAEYLRFIPEKALRDYSEEVIRCYQYGEFHWSLASARINRELPKGSRLKRPLQYLLLLLKASEPKIVSDKKKLYQLRRVSKLIRKMAIVAIDSKNSHVPLTFDLSSAILSMDLTEHTFAGQSIEGMLNPLLGALTDILYADEDVLSLMRDYEIQAESVLDSMDLSDALIQAYDKGVVKNFSSEYRHFHRQVVPIHAERDRYEERRYAERLVRRIGPERMQVDDNKQQGKRYLDFLTPIECVSKEDVGRCIYITCRNLTNVIGFQARGKARNQLMERDWWKTQLYEAGADSAVVDLVDGKCLERLGEQVGIGDIVDEKCSSIIASTVKLLLRPPYTLTIDPSEAYSKHYATYAVNGKGRVLDLYSDPIAEAIARTVDEGRKNEIQFVRDQRKPKGCWFRLACFAQIIITDRTKPPGKRTVTDFDGLIVTGKNSEITVDILEAKAPSSGSVGRARKDLRENIKPLIRSNLLPGYRISRHKRGAKLSITLPSP